ncbi:Cytochrome P450 [Penicillium riverlandense]|uniref:Cytochrome P450 n=1 Tax=Penicillium riverlandense TaxID=1903569 RepID=UPI002549AD12|nr:Cytochrome P450 [Penicillium riverlandense]KAJ5812109.1 Cytochrome P450 [Penicillium riverlandense]
MAALTGMVCMLLIVAVPFYLILHRSSNSPKHLLENRTSDPGQCQVLIAGTLARNGKHNRLNPQESRIIPNQNRRIAFGIDNIFTSLNSEHAQSFLRQAKQRINLEQERWNQIAELARESARSLTLNGSKKGSNADGVFKVGNDSSIRINLVSLVSIISLKVVLFTMFDRGDGDDTNDLVLDAFAKAINWTWIASKQRNPDLVPRFEDNSNLRFSLRAIFGNDDAGHTNPLNFIIPSFETLWRVVLRVFVEVGFSTGAAAHPEWKNCLTAFSRHPTKEQFEAATYMNLEDSAPAHDIPSAKHIVFESLRLYPPTRRIHRAYQWSDNAAEDNQEPKAYDDMAEISKPVTYARISGDRMHLSLVPYGGNSLHRDSKKPSCLSDINLSSVQLSLFLGHE